MTIHKHDNEAVDRFVIGILAPRVLKSEGFLCVSRPAATDLPLPDIPSPQQS